VEPGDGELTRLAQATRFRPTSGIGTPHTSVRPPQGLSRERHRISPRCFCPPHDLMRDRTPSRVRRKQRSPEQAPQPVDEPNPCASSSRSSREDKPLRRLRSRLLFLPFLGGQEKGAAPEADREKHWTIGGTPHRDRGSMPRRHRSGLLHRGIPLGARSPRSQFRTDTPVNCDHPPLRTGGGLPAHSLMVPPRM
jgi:hypothetical protein